MRQPLAFSCILSSILSLGAGAAPAQVSDPSDRTVWRDASARGPDGEPVFLIDLAFGGGRFRHRTIGSNLDGSEDAGFFRLSGEGYSATGLGGGLRLEGIGVDEDLFADQGFTGLDIGAGELFLYLGVRLASEDFAMPIRLGLVLHGYSIDDPTGNDIEYNSSGARLEVEPEGTLLSAPTLRWSLYGTVSVAVLGTTVETTPATVEADATSLLLGLEAGTRLRVGPARLGLGLVHRYQRIDDSEVVAGIQFFGVDTTFTGLLLSVGVVF
jgi:hypothetical protein